MAFNQRGFVAGVLLVLLGAILFSAKAVIIKIAYRYEVDSVSLLTLRMVFSLPFFLFLAVSSRQKTQKPVTMNRGDFWRIALFGITGYYLASLLDFIGLNYVSASMERLILFVYPTLVILLNRLFLKIPIEPRQLFALLLTYFGIALAFLEGLELEGGNGFVLGCAIIFCSALAYAVYLIGSGALIPKYGPRRYTAYAMTAASIVIILQHAFTQRLALFHFPPAVYWLSILMAIFCTVIPSFLISAGIQRIGSSNASIVGSIGPISTILLAYIFLNETLGLWQWLGTLLVIGGVLLVSAGTKTVLPKAKA